MLVLIPARGLLCWRLCLQSHKTNALKSFKPHFNFGANYVKQSVHSTVQQAGDFFRNVYYVEKWSWTLFLSLNKSKTITSPPKTAFTNSNLRNVYNSREFLTDCPVSTKSQLCCGGDLSNNIHSNTLPAPLQHLY